MCNTVPHNHPGKGTSLRAQLKGILENHPRLLGITKRLRSLLSHATEALAATGLASATAVDVALHPWFLRDLQKYRAMGAETSIKDIFPQLHDKTSCTPFDPHYFYQSAWAARLIHDSGTSTHYDVGSSNMFVGMITAFVTVVFIDIRPLPVAMERLTSLGGTVLDLPMSDQSIASLSCLHVAEHIGLGRYGDPLDPEGTTKAAAELQRVLAPSGNLYFSLPVGRARTQFNAHRITRLRDVPAMFPELELLSVSVVDDRGTWHPDASLDGWDGQTYACGMFHFRRAR